MRVALHALALAFWGWALSVSAAEAPAGRERILGMAGCFAVTYRFYEDGRHDYFNEDYGLDAPITELVTVVEDAPERVTLQHSAVNELGELVPHWHEEWRHGEAGWTQTVYSRTRDDEARERRYTCTAPWSRNRWHCRAGRAGKPFRDRGAPFGFARPDYDRLDRTNTLLVTPEGWVHSQHNRKKDADGRLVSYELGFIVYDRLDEGDCPTPPGERTEPGAGR